MPYKLTERNIKTKIVSTTNYPPADTYEVRDSEHTGLVVIVRTSGEITFCLRYRNRAGKAKKYTIGKYGKVTATKARQIAKELLGEVAAGKDIQAERRDERAQALKLKNSTIRYFLEHKYEDRLLTETKSGHDTIKRLKSNFNDWYNQPMSDITSWQVTSWRSKKVKAGRKASTVNRDISALKAMLSKAVEWGDLVENPLQKLKPLETDRAGVIRFLSDSEEEVLRRALDNRQDQQRKKRGSYNEWLKIRKKSESSSLRELCFTDHLKPIVLLALNTGMRRGELFNLRGGDVDLSQRIVTARGEGNKGGQTRNIPLNDEAFQILTSWINQQAVTKYALVFPSPKTGKRFKDIKKSWGALIDSSGVENFRFHDIRHTFASKLVMRGVDLYTVMELLGHRSIETTQRYAHLAPEHKAKAVVELLNG